MTDDLNKSDFVGVDRIGDLTESTIFASSTWLTQGQVETLGETTLGGSRSICFGTGTLIRTARGDVAVEDLQIGDSAVTASGEYRPIRWIGNRSIDLRRCPRPEEAQPVCIRAHAFDENRPARDLRLSPSHGIGLDLLGEVIVPAFALVNGATIVRDEVESVTYWQVELDEHDLLVAENMLAESCRDRRTRLEESGSVALRVGGPSLRRRATLCRPFHDGGHVVAFVRARLRERALRYGWQLREEPWAQAHLMVDGQRIEPDIRGPTARFIVPAGARDVWLVSQTGVPCHVGPSEDGRDLGLCLTSLRVEDGWSAPRALRLDDPLLCLGFHPPECDDGELRRWTAGRARLPVALWSGCESAFLLWIDLALPTLPRWRAPEVSAEARVSRAGEAAAA